MTTMERVLARGLVVLGLVLGAATPGQATETVVYYHTDALGSPVAETDANGQVIANSRRTYEPYGKQLSPQPLEDGPGYTGHVSDAATGLSYMQQRYYDPKIGAFLSVDPIPVDSISAWNFNRYNYAANNPYKFTDPDGRCIDGASCEELGHTITNNEKAFESLRPIAKAVLGSMLAASGIGEIVGVVRAGITIHRALSETPRTEVVQRAMSRDEVQATESTGLVRGGRGGTHHVSDSVNSSAGRARQRLALPQTPQVRATMEVPQGHFSEPSRVVPNYNMPGGGMERTATGQVPARIIRVEELAP